MVEADLVEEKRVELMGRLGVHFARVEPFAEVSKYVRGLMNDPPRKNCWTLAEYAGDATPDRMQRLPEHASWDTMAAMGTVRDFVAEYLACGNGLAVLVLDESGDEKTGTAICAGLADRLVRARLQRRTLLRLGLDLTPLARSISC